jgi:predicted O-linked N-acetylglucosamine transferase (SPINDLY family)
MGSLQAKPDAIQHQNTSIAATSAMWLDDFITTLPSETIAPLHAQQIQSRLKTVPLEALLSAVERARPHIGRPAEIAIYKRWIDANSGNSSVLYAAWFNLGVLFAASDDHVSAAAAYGTALALRPDMHSAAINLGFMLEQFGQPEKALETWKRAAQPDDARLALEIQQGRLLEKMGRLDEAEKILRRVLLSDPDQPDVIHHWVHIRQKCCLWPVVPSNMPDLSSAEILGRSGPLGILALTDDIDLQRNTAASWVNRKTQAAPVRLAPPTPYPHKRIRIGYMSSDFCSHAMSYLITELFERHDRARFEVFGYDSSREDGTELRKRVVAAFDHHRLIRTLSDDQAAQVIRDDEIDVLIDLNGITEGSRVTVLRWKPAPIQATYLGYIGPLPMPELDYLLCDTIVIPPEHEAAYEPRPLPIARIYQANDSKRTIGRPISRAEVGLPEESFVMCCFSRHYKVTEDMFGAWMSVLQQSPRAVLWLAQDNAFSKANLLSAAARAGVAPNRLIFSERADPDLYLSRLGVADLFLDTYPYNAGTVASDAIRMRLPLITLCGDAFASRMAASLLHAVGAPQGITTSLPKYVRTIVRLANDPTEYARYKALFTDQAWTRTIGDIAAFTADYEATWCRIVRDAQENPAGSRSD